MQILFQKTSFLFIAVCLALSCTQVLAYPRSDKPQPFYMGVYMYEYQMEAVAKEQNQDFFTFMEDHLKILKAHGVNAIYLGGTNRSRFEKNIKLFAKYNMVVIPQLDFAYYQPTWSEQQLKSYAKAAAEFINKYADDPNILAFSVREEIPGKSVKGLSNYYSLILSLAPKARFQLVNNNLTAATDLPAPYPAILGTDRYGFWWEFSGGGYLATPGSALKWTREQAELYYWQAARRGADFSLVVTQGGLMAPKSANHYLANESNILSNGDLKLQQRLQTFSSKGRMGWGEFKSSNEKRYNVWKYYRLPQNAMRALAWTAVLKGAKSFFVWSYSPLKKKDLELDFKSASFLNPSPASINYISLAGRAGSPNPQFDEFSKATDEIRPYQNIITRMERVNESIIRYEQIDVFQSTFSLRNLKGKVVVIHNANIGTWLGDSTHPFDSNNDIKIDGEGNLVKYEPFIKPININFHLADHHTKEKAFDLQTGKELIANNNQYTVQVEPGSGLLIYVGNEEEVKMLKMD